jgi:exodeoxyribonuclease VII large subunit
MGEMAVKRQLIIKKLEQDGVISMNKDLTFPALPQRIAVISSKTAAGYSDFINHLKINSFGYSFFTTLIEATLQGSETERSVIGALHKIALEYFRYDIVVIIRGGGSQSDLSWFDNYNIAYFITQFPIPVITGIGHEKDISVTDLVAHKALKTPTAVADFLIESVSTAENHIMEMSSEIIAASRIIIEKNKNIIESSRIRLFPLTRIMISGLKDKLSSEIIEIIDIGKELVVRAWLIPANQQSRLASVVRSFSSEKDIMLKQKSQRLMVSTLNSTGSKNIMLNGLENKLQLLNPENILQRGYSITTIKGKILRKSDEVKKGDIVETRLNEGSFKSKVVVREQKEKEADEEGQIDIEFGVS